MFGLGVQGPEPPPPPPPGVGGFEKEFVLLLLLLDVLLLLLLLTGELLGIDIGESMLTSTDLSRLGGGGCVDEGHWLSRPPSSCFTSCFTTDTGFQEAVLSIVTSSTSVLK